MNSLNSRERTELTFRLRLRRKLERLAAKKHPAAFRRSLTLTSDAYVPFHSIEQPWQRADFHALDEAWRRLAGFKGEPEGVSPRRPTVFQRAYMERPRGHSKTSDMAMQLAWILQNATRRVEGLAAAADREQAALIRDAVFRLASCNPEFCSNLSFTKFEVTNKITGSRLTVISSDVQSSWGVLPDFIICDELCHWDKPDMWYSLLSSAAKKRDCLLAVLTNAGVGRGWQWDVRETARTSPRWHFSSLQEPQAAWIDPQHLEEQRRLLPGPVFDRLWRNLWQHSDGEFVTLAEVEACRDERLQKREQGQPGVRYFAAVDYAEKHDYTVGVVVHQEGPRVIVDRMDVAVPRPDHPVPVLWVEDWMRNIAGNFHGVTFVVDEYQLLSTIQRLEHHYPVHRFEFAGARGNHRLAITLRRLILQRDIAWYPGCGEIGDIDQRAARRQPAEERFEQQQLDEPSGGLRPPACQAVDNLETELASLLLRQSPSGYCRIRHHQDGKHHDDRAFALGAACLLAMQNTGDESWLLMTEPTRAGGFDLR